MPPQQQQQQPKQGWSLDDKFFTIVALGQIVGKSAEPFLRVPGSAGSRYFGVQTLISLFGGFLWIAVKEPVLAVYFFWAVVAMLVLHRIAGRWVRTPGEHTMYSGLPWFTALLRVDEISAKGPYEFLLVLLSGSVIWGAGHVGLGSWMVVSAFGLAVSSAYMTMRDNAMDRARSDALAQQRIAVGRWQQHENPAPARQGRSHIGMLLLLALVAGAGWFLYSGTVTLPASLMDVIPRHAPLTAEEKAELEAKENARQAERQWHEMEARERAIRRAWRRRNEEAGFYY
jgi:hypothetical protein